MNTRITIEVLGRNLLNIEDVKKKQTGVRMKQPKIPIGTSAKVVNLALDFVIK